MSRSELHVAVRERLPNKAKAAGVTPMSDGSFVIKSVTLVPSKAVPYPETQPDTPEL